MRSNIVRIAILMWLSPICLYAQEQPFSADIKAFLHTDSVQRPNPGVILFVGSSSFTMWTDVSSCFPGYPILNRGFGGSTLKDVLYYADKIIIPYQPRQVVVYCGENDFAESDTVSSATVLLRFTALFNLIRSGLPAAKVSYISMKPSPSRMHLFCKMNEANARIKTFLKRQPNTSYINVVDVMMNHCRPRPELYREDSLHMLPVGYKLWTKKIKPHLIEQY